MDPLTFKDRSGDTVYPRIDINKQVMLKNGIDRFGRDMLLRIITGDGGDRIPVFSLDMTTGEMKRQGSVLQSNIETLAQIVGITALTAYDANENELTGNDVYQLAQLF